MVAIVSKYHKSSRQKKSEINIKTLFGGHPEAR